MKVRSTLVAIFFVTLAAFGVSSGVSYSSLDELTDVQEQSEQAAEDVTLFLDLTVSVNRFAKEVVDAFDGETSSEFGEAKSAAAAKFDAIERRLGVSGGSASQRAHNVDVLSALKKARGLFETLEKDATTTIAARAAGDVPDEAQLQLAMERDYDHGFLAVINKLLTDEREYARGLLGQTQEISRKAKRSVITTAVLATLLLALLLGASLRSIDRAIRELVSGAERLADGDLDRRVTTTGTNEFGQIGTAFNQMAEKLVVAQREKIRSERLSAVGQAAASVGHDLRNPLAAIRNASHYIRRRVADSDLKTNARVAEFLVLIERELDTSTKIISDLLDFARDRKLTTSTCTLGEVVSEAISVVTPPRPTQIENHVGDDLPLVNIDKVQMRQALVNIIQNATESVPEAREGRVEVRATAAGKAIIMTIRDNGEGMPPDRCASIFEPFFTTKTKGTGLGLAITAGVIERHRGKISVESQLGAGTTFRIEIPIEGGQDTRAMPKATEGEPA